MCNKYQLKLADMTIGFEEGTIGKHLKISLYIEFSMCARVDVDELFRVVEMELAFSSLYVPIILFII